MKDLLNEWELWVSSGALAVFLGFFRTIRGLVEKWGAQRAFRGWFNIEEVYSSLNRVFSAADPDRVLLLKAHNGGGVPNPKEVIKTTVVSELYDTIPVKDLWQSSPVDAEYHKVITALLRNGSTVLSTDSLKTSRLKSYYIDHGVKDSYVFLVGTTKDAVWYLAIHNPKKGSFTSSAISECNRIRELLGAHWVKTKEFQ